MFVQIELKASKNKEPTKKDMQKNIDTLNRTMKTASSLDHVILLDTKSILNAIMLKLPNG